MKALLDLLGSERGFIALLLVIGSTVLTITGHMTVEQWTDFNKWIVGFYIVGKSVTSAIETIKGRPESQSPPG